MKILAVIPARSGSKGLKNKNIKLINGYPLLYYSIKAAQKSKKINKIICSTDSKLISKIAIKYGAEVPFLRPKNISGDLSTDIQLLRHVIKKIRKNFKPDLVVFLRPTSPLRPTNLIDKMILKINKFPNADSIRTVCRSNHNPIKAWKSDKKYILPLVKLKNIKYPNDMPRQKLPDTFVQTGHVDIIRYKTLLNNKFSGNKVLPYIIDHKLFIDIDNINDFKLANKRLKKFKF